METEKKRIETEDEVKAYSTVGDIRFPNRSEMRVFGKTYSCSQDVYVKIRVELIDPNNYGNHTTFIMSFHFAETSFSEKDFPYRRSKG